MLQFQWIHLRMSRLFPVFIFLCFALNSTGQGQTDETRNYTKRDGLPSNETYIIFRDSRNYLWIGTDDGVVRFNGTVMEQFGLPDNGVYKISEDEEGRVWFFTQTGRLFYFSGGKVSPYKFNDEILRSQPSPTIVNGIVYKNEVYFNSISRFNTHISTKGKIDLHPYYFGGDFNMPLAFEINNIGPFVFASKISDNAGIYETIKVKIKSGPVPREYSLLYNNRSKSQYGAIIIGQNTYFFSANSIYKLEPDGSFYQRSFENDVLSVREADSTHIWVGLLKGGVVLLNTNVLENTDRHLLKDYSVSSVTIDHEGGAWFSTLEKGIFYLPKTSIHVFDENNFAGKPVYRLHAANDSSLLAVTNDGIFRLYNNKITPVFHSHVFAASDLRTDGRKILLAGDIPMRVTAVPPDYKNCIAKSLPVEDKMFESLIYFPGNSRLIENNSHEYLFNQGTYSYLINLLYPYYSKGVKTDFFAVQSYFNTNKGQYFKGTDGKIWFNSGNFFGILNLSTEKMEKFKENDSTINKGVVSMAQFSEGTYALGVRSGGILLMKDSIFTGRITEKEGLSSNTVRHMLVSGNELWISTPKSISVISFQSFSPLRYTIRNAERNEEFMNTVIYQLYEYNNKILAATSDGIYYLDKTISETENDKSVLPFYITNISSSAGDTSEISSIELPYRKNKVTISFNAVSFDAPGDVKYYYRIGDASWERINSTVLTMDNLSPGTYDIQLKAEITEQERYSAVRNFRVTILKPWWQDNFFRAAVILCLLAVIIFIFKRRIKSIKAKAQQKLQMQTQLLELEHKALRSQMNPHFIFNCLTSIQHLIVEGDGKTANDYLVKFARLIRSTLEISKDSFISLEDEENYITDYVKLEKLRFGNLFNFSISRDPQINTRETSIPNMMIQPIIENSIRHGMKNAQTSSGNIELVFAQQKDVIICTIKDNGRGRGVPAKNEEFKKHKSFGIEIINNRLSIFNPPGEKKYFLEIRDLEKANGEKAGTEVILHLPIKKAQH